jgi:hypothetical protein
LVGAGCTVYPSSVPAKPAYDTDVRPIFLAHCTRCHGAGPGDGSANVTTLPTGPDAASQFSTSEVRNFIFLAYYLTQYNSTNCEMDDAGVTNPACHQGALTVASSLSPYIDSDPSALFHMPPPPAQSLNDYERAVVDSWCQNPICSNSSNPDPIICPPGSGP